MRETAATNSPQERTWPFPHLPEVIRARYAADDLSLRPFGVYEGDLNVDFAQHSRPFLVTRLLECCTLCAADTPVDQALFWDLPVGKRIECLLTLIGAQVSEINL